MDRLFLPALLALAALLLFARLDDRYLWQDEAETALLGRSVLRQGVPTGFDGRNWISQEMGRELSRERHVWLWTPWLPHYLAAGSFALLGESTWSARLPFALLGLLAIAATYRLALEATGERRAARIAAVVVVLSVPFLLHMRQCRYYAPQVLFSVLLVLAYLRVLAGRRRAHWGLALAATGLLHAHYVVGLGMLAGLGAHFVLLERRKAVLRPLLVGVGLALAGFAPWLVAFGLHTAGDVSVGADRARSTLVVLAVHVNAFAFPLPLLLGIPLLARLRGPADADRWAAGRRVLAPALAGLVCAALLALVMPLFFFRYYLELIPLFAVPLAWITSGVWAWRPLAGAAVLAVVALTDLPARLGPTLTWAAWDPSSTMTGDERSADVVGAWATPFPLAAYLYEITHEVTGPTEHLVAYLREHARTGDVVLATYEDLPLQFYTELEVIGGLSGRDPRPLPRIGFVVIRHATHATGDGLLKEFLRRELDWHHFERVALGVLDVPYESRPAPHYHKFRTARSGVPPLHIYRRLDR